MEESHIVTVSKMKTLDGAEIPLRYSEQLVDGVVYFCMEVWHPSGHDPKVWSWFRTSWQKKPPTITLP